MLKFDENTATSMEPCPHCGGGNDDWASACAHCGRTFGVRIAAKRELSHIAYLLRQMEGWQSRNLLPDNLTDTLREGYLRQRADLKQQLEAPVNFGTTLAPHSPTVPPLPPSQESPPAPEPSGIRLLLQEHALKVIFTAAAVLVVAALRSLLQWNWMDAILVMLIPVLPLALTGMFWFFGQRTREENPWAALIYHALTPVLMVFNVFAANRYWLAGALPVETTTVFGLLMATATSSVLLRRWREVPYLHLFLSSTLIALYATLHALSNSPHWLPAPNRLFAGAYLSACAICLLFAVRTPSDIEEEAKSPSKNPWRMAWALWAHIAFTLSLGIVLLNSASVGGVNVQEGAALAFVAALIYGAAAQLLRMEEMVLVSGGLLAVGSACIGSADKPGWFLGVHCGMAVLLVSALTYTLALYNAKRELKELSDYWKGIAQAGVVWATIIAFIPIVELLMVPKYLARVSENLLPSVLMMAFCGAAYTLFAVKERSANYLYGTLLCAGTTLLGTLSLAYFPKPLLPSALLVYSLVLCVAVFALQKRGASLWEGQKVLGNSGLIGLNLGMFWQSAYVLPAVSLSVPLWVLLGVGVTLVTLWVSALLESKAWSHISILSLLFSIITTFIARSDRNLSVVDELGTDVLMVCGGVVLALAYRRTALRNQAGEFSYVAAFLLTGSYLRVVTRIGLEAVWLGLLLLPFCISLYALGVWFERKGKEEQALMGQPFQKFALFLSYFALLWAVGIESLQVSIALETPLWVVSLTLLLYGLAYGALALFRRSAKEAGLCAVILTAAFAHALLSHTELLSDIPTLSLPRFAFWFIQAGVFWFGIGWQLRRRFDLPEFSKPLLSLAAGVALISAAVGIMTVQMPGQGSWVVLTLAWAGAIWFGLWLQEMGEACLHIGTWNLLIAWLIVLYDKIGFAPPLLDIYLLPIGIYVTLIGFRERRRTSPNSGHPFWLMGMFLLLTPGLLLYWQRAEAWHTVLFLTECVVAIFWGIAQRIRAFVSAGVGFLLAYGVLHFGGSVSEVWGTLFTLIVGVSLFVLGFYALTHRETIQRWIAAAEKWWALWSAWN